MKYAALVMVIVVALFCRVFFVSVYKVSSQTMAPTLLVGDFILVSKTSYGIKLPWSNDVYFSASPKHGDLVVFHKNSKIYIKRVLAVAGDEIEKLKLDKLQVFVASDNRGLDNKDSENEQSVSETISTDQIIGKPLFVWMSYSSTQDFISKTTGVRWNRILTKLN